jgi:hypothetical protein
MRVYQGGSPAADAGKHATTPAASCTHANIGTADTERSSSNVGHKSTMQVSCTIFLLTYRNSKRVSAFFLLTIEVLVFPKLHFKG